MESAMISYFPRSPPGILKKNHFMARLLGIDFETTGLDTGNDRITEIGFALWDTDTHKPLVTHGIFLWDSGIDARCNPETIAMMKRVSGITLEILKEFGIDPKASFEALDKFCIQHKVQYLIAHNAENFDKPILFAELTRHQVVSTGLRTLPWIDTRTDLPFISEPDSRKLKHLALDCGFINPFSHRAIFDVLTMLKVLSHYEIEKVITYSKIPFVTIRALVEYKDRELAKARRFSWEKIGDKTFSRQWVKRIKMDQLANEVEACSFKIIELQEG